MGEKVVPMVTDHGRDKVGTWQMVDVVRPLNSVRKVCKQGNRVIFGAEGGVIQDIHTGEEIPFGVEDEIYTLDLWLPPENQTGVRHWGEGDGLGFTRQGR